VIRPHLNGRRGWFLILFAAAYLMVGVSYTCLPLTPARTHTLAWLLQWVPANVIGDCWFAAATVALVSAFLPLPRDRHGFVALFAVPALMGVVYAISWAVHDAPGGLVTTLLDEMIATAVLVVSGMPNPVTKVRP
jgi:hypothetical protein